MKRYFIVLVSIIFCFLLVACNKQISEESTVDYETITAETNTEILVPEVTKGGTIKLSMNNAKTLNPLENDDYSVDQILKIIFEPLIVIENNQDISSNLLKKWEFSEDASKCILVLNDDVFWHDGAEITADDVIYSFETLKTSHENAIYKKSMDYIAAVSKIDEKTFEIEFRNPGYINIYALNFPLIPSHHYGDSDSDKSFAPLGNSSYQFRSYEAMKKLFLVKFSNANIDSIEIIITTDENAALYSFGESLIDLISAKITDLGKYAFSREYSLEQFSTQELDFLAFNFNNSLLAKKECRQIFEYLLNKDEILTSLYLSYAEKTCSILSKNSAFYDINLVSREYNKAKAKDLLELLPVKMHETENYLYDINDGRMEKLSFRMLINSENITRKNIAEMLKEEFELIGVEIVIESVPEEEYIEKIAARDYDILVTGMKFSVMPDFGFLFNSFSDGNIMNYKNDEVNIILEDIMKSTSKDIFAKRLIDLQNKLYEELPIIPIAFRNTFLASSVNIHGELKPSQDFLYKNIEEIFITVD